MTTGAAAIPRDLFDRLKAVELADRDVLITMTAAGYDVTDAAERTRSVADLTRLFFAIAAALEVDLFIEAGAKDATSSRTARRLLDPGRIVAFEANPFTHRRQAAQHDFAAAGVEYLHTALAAEAGEVTFQVLRAENGQPRSDGQSSLLRRNDPDAAQNVVEVTVPAATLDGFFDGHQYARSAIWVDVEGAMQPVLAGGGRTVERAAVVIAEVEDRAYWAGQWLRADVVSYFYDRGLVPIARDYQSRYQYNIVFVAREFLDHDRVRWLITRHTSVSAHPRKPKSAAPRSPKAKTVRSTRSVDLAKVILRRAVATIRRRISRTWRPAR